MRWLGCAPGRGIGVALLALTAACPFARGEEAPAAERGARIGVSTRAVSHAPREGRNSSVSGLKVIEVTPGSPAAEAGIEPGDVLMRLDSRNLKVPDDLVAAELAIEPGRPVEVVLDRGGRTIMTFRMETGPAPATSAPLLITGVPPTASAATDTAAQSGAGAIAGTGVSAGAAIGAAGANAASGDAASGGGVAPAAGAVTDPNAAPGTGAASAGGASDGGAVSGGNAAAALGATAVVTVAATAAGGDTPAAAQADSAGADSTTVPVPPLAGAGMDTSTITASAPATPPSDPRTGAAGLGVRCENLSLDLAKALGAKPGQGVLVLEVTTGSPADRAGIRPGDVITFAADQQVVDVQRLDQILATATSPLSISTLRRGTTHVASVAFGDASQTEDVTALRNEVKSLQDEVRKLREELAKTKTHP
jgi:membrane-associated protease RseP (regulator of RpoE activity)